MKDFLYFDTGSGLKKIDRSRGTIRFVTGSAPAAGADILETVPAGKAWHLKSLKTSLLTEGTAGTRVVKLTVDNGVGVAQEFNTALSHAATLTCSYSWIEGWGTALGSSGVAGGSAITTGLPPELILPAGCRINTLTVLIKPLDQYAAPMLYVVEYDLT